MNDDVLQAALYWLDLGFSLVPLQPNSKHHVRGFGAYLERITSADGARYWFGERRCNLGLVCGGRLVCLDFDNQAAYDQVGASIESLTEKTRRGYHVLVYSDQVKRPCRVSESFEVKAGGAVVAVSPSVVAGVRYQVVKPLPVVAFDLSACLPSLSFLSESKKRLEGKSASGDVVSKCKRALDILQVAQELQAARGLPVLLERRGRPAWWGGLCPFHNERRPSYFVNIERGFYLCRSCGARGDVLNLYQVLHGLGSVQEVIRVVAYTLPN